MPWGAVAGAVIGAYGASQQGKSAGKAADASAQAAQAANAAQLQMFNQQRQDQEPFRQAGLVGINEYMAMMGLPTSTVQGAGQQPTGMNAMQQYLQDNPDVASDPYFSSRPYEHFQRHGQAEGRVWGAKPAPAATANPAAPTKTPQQLQQDAFAKLRNTPGYQFGLDEGNKSVQASAAARGGLNSGATLKALMKFGNNYADQQGYTPYMNKLASLAGIGQTATNQIGAAGQSTAQIMGQNTMNAGNARAQGIYAKGQAWGDYANDMAGMVNYGFQNNWGRS
jgi:hypothetical protein